MRVFLLALALSIPAHVTLGAPARTPTTTTRTAPAPAGAGTAAGAGAAAMLDRARDAVHQLQLTADQKTKVDTIFKEARAELEQMRTQLESMEVRDRLAQAREFLEGVRADVASVLTPPQRRQMQQKFEQLRDAAGPGLGAGPGALPPGALAERLRAALPKLNLSGDQAAQLKSLFEDLTVKADALRQQTEPGTAEARTKARELADETRDKLAEILTPEQQAKLREAMRAPTPRERERDKPATRRGAKATGAGTGAAAGAGDQMSEMTMSGAGEDMMSMDGASARKPKPPAPAAESDNDPAKPPPGPAVGDVAPDFTLQKIDGGQVSLAPLKGRVVVLVFGSYSAPTFRNRAAALEKLRAELGTRASVFVVYAREAHPTGEWEVARNKEDGVSVEQAKTLDARKAAAAAARAKLKMVTPILLDTIGNETATAYGAGPNSAYVIGRDGTIAARQQWFEPLALRRAINAAVAAKPATKPAAP